MSKKINSGGHALSLSKGFTLIGLLIAAMILAIVAIAASQIFGTALSAANTARQQFIAVNIAREGLELVHAVRDTNWLTSDDRSHWLDHGLCSDGINQFTDNNRQFIIEPSDVQNLANVRTNSTGALFLKSDGSYTYQFTNQPTPFSRLMSIDCTHKDDAAPYVIVTSTVSWTVNNRAHSVVLKEQLFNWLPTQLKLNP